MRKQPCCACYSRKELGIYNTSERPTQELTADAKSTDDFKPMASSSNSKKDFYAGFATASAVLLAFSYNVSTTEPTPIASSKMLGRRASRGPPTSLASRRSSSVRRRPYRRRPIRPPSSLAATRLRCSHPLTTRWPTSRLTCASYSF